ncbi:UV excision repair protein Rad23 [Aspergillus heteromorphus CBS 117.55]|uniref:UV excision repair protein RAD23 n=1 Tax=Aspergillus heteromorphus CBS 117.55 TaxID=1448321 RepID=A0A317V767_9EURO|nr:UV excision repair protein Rad23 [Aspergillus heteromorphus CBS 117.55]PWY70193.1 UV excision repair protein Rad23 [Aspergillus heteromorphus CBS 117.55]
MKLTFKDLKQQKFVIDAEPSETVGQVKEKISKEKGWEVPQLKLIYSGKILQDDKTIETYNIEEKGFIVCMVSKVCRFPLLCTLAYRPLLWTGANLPFAVAQGFFLRHPLTSPSTPSRAATSTPLAPPAPAPSNTAAAAAAAAPPATPSPAAPGATQAPASSFNDPSALLSGAQSETVAAQMESMGFPRSDVDRAMRAAYFNPDRAIEYLLNGIPDNIQQEQHHAAAAAAGSPQAAAEPTGESAPASADDEPVNLFEAAAQAGGQEGGARGPRAGGASGEGLPSLDFLRNNPHFQQLRQLVQQQPQMLEPILQQVAAGNPQIAQLIGQNEEQFLQLLSEEGEEAAPPGTHQIHVTEEERDAIERLCRLGFSRDLVIQAYFACDKNEELAANYLFENPDDTDDL